MSAENEAGALLVLAALAVGLGLRYLSRPDPNGTSLYLDCIPDNRNGWTFETEDGPAEPEFSYGCFGGSSSMICMVARFIQGTLEHHSKALAENHRQNYQAAEEKLRQKA